MIVEEKMENSTEFFDQKHQKCSKNFKAKKLEFLEMENSIFQDQHSPF